MSYRLGIDIGTTYSTAAVSEGGGARVINLGTHSASIPSVVASLDDQTIVGEAAARRLATDPHRVASHFKRRLGDETPILLGTDAYSASQLTARLLREIYDLVVEREGGEPHTTVVTHPADWGDHKLDLLREGLRLAGLESARLMAEPVAAAIFYASQERVPSGTSIAVYDLGGGTFDSAVVRKTDSGFEIVGAPEGLDQIGGIDFDEAVFRHVTAAIADDLADLATDDENVIAGLAHLREECVKAKEALSTDTDVSIPVRLPGVHTDVRLTRAEFEEMIRPSLTETVESLRRTLQSASLDSADVDRILLVGGSSRIPLIADVVAGEMGRPVGVDTDPKHPIAMGAALDPEGRSRTGAAVVVDAATMGGSVRPWMLAVAGLTIIALVAALVSALDDDSPELAGGEIFLEPADSPGTDPFSPDFAFTVPVVAPELRDAIENPPQPPTVDPGDEGGQPLTIAATAGGERGLYGGTLDNTSCDVDAMVAFFVDNPDKAEAWAAVQGIEVGELEDYLRSLTPLVLTRDTRVTNHGFRDGAARPLQSILQAGTAVLVDDEGVPRARCACGNPLLEPEPVSTTPEYVGDPWPEFDETNVQVIAPASDPLDEFVVVDVATGDEFDRPVGSTGDRDHPVGTEAPPPPDSDPTTEPVTADGPDDPAEDHPACLTRQPTFTDAIERSRASLAETEAIVAAGTTQQRQQLQVYIDNARWQIQSFIIFEGFADYVDDATLEAHLDAYPETAGLSALEASELSITIPEQPSADAIDVFLELRSTVCPSYDTPVTASESDGTTSDTPVGVEVCTGDGTLCVFHQCVAANEFSVTGNATTNADVRYSEQIGGVLDPGAPPVELDADGRFTITHTYTPDDPDLPLELGIYGDADFVTLQIGCHQ